MRKATIHSFSLPGILFLLFSALPILSAKAQTYTKGTNVISASVGIDGWPIDQNNGYGTLLYALQYERGLWKVGPGVISLGAFAGTKRYDFYNVKDPRNNSTYTTFGLRGAYHFTELPVSNLDFYTGVMVSDDRNSFSANLQGEAALSKPFLGANIFVGGRYFFLGDLGAFAELCSAPYHFIDLGLAVKF